MTRHIVQWSGGAGSAYTGWLVSQDLAPGDELLLVFADTKMEDEDTYRFSAEAAAAIPGAELIVLAEGRDVWQVFFDERYLGNTRVDPCSKILKRQMVRRWLDANVDPADAVIYLGIDWTEAHRFTNAKPRWAPFTVSAPMVERCIDKDEAKIARLREGVMPIYEPGLEALVEGNVSAGRLSFTTDLAEGIAGARERSIELFHRVLGEVVGYKQPFRGAVLRGEAAPPPRRAQVLDAMNLAAGPMIGREYVTRYLPDATRARATEIAAQVRDALGRGIDRNTWMSTQARIEAKAKLARLSIEVGAPAIEFDFDVPPMGRGSFGGNMLIASTWRHREEMRRIGSGNASRRWNVQPQQPALSYDVAQNRLVVTAAMLQPPVLDMNRDPAANYGALGALVGHELSHGFDSRGRMVDAGGNIRNWWGEPEMTAWQGLAAVRFFQGDHPGTLQALEHARELSRFGAIRFDQF